MLSVSKTAAFIITKTRTSRTITHTNLCSRYVYLHIFRTRNPRLSYHRRCRADHRFLSCAPSRGAYGRHARTCFACGRCCRYSYWMESACHRAHRRNQQLPCYRAPQNKTRRQRVGACAVSLRLARGSYYSFLARQQRREQSNLVPFWESAHRHTSDLLPMAAPGAVVMATVAFFFQPLLTLTFDETFARTIGLPVRRLTAVLAALTAAVITLAI